MLAGLGDEQWRAFGAALRAVHDSGLGERFRGHLRSETFALPSAGLVRQLLNMVHGRSLENPIAERFAAFWRERAGQIEQVLARAESLGRSLRGHDGSSRCSATRTSTWATSWSRRTAASG